MECSRKGKCRSVSAEILQHPRSKRCKSGHGSPASCKENSMCNGPSSTKDRSGMLISLSAHTDRFTCLYCRINFLCEKHLVDHMKKYHGYVKVRTGGEPGGSAAPCQKQLEATVSDGFGDQSPAPSPPTPSPAVPTSVSSAGVLRDKTQTSQSGIFRTKPYHRPLIMTVKITKPPSSQMTWQASQLSPRRTQQISQLSSQMSRQASQMSSQMTQQACQTSLLSPPATPELCKESDSSSETIDVVS